MHIIMCLQLSHTLLHCMRVFVQRYMELDTIISSWLYIVIYTN